MKNAPKNTDGIFVRRQNQPLRRRRTLDTMKVPSRYLADSSADTAGSLAKKKPHPDGPPALTTRNEQALPMSQGEALPRPMPSKAATKAIDIDLSLDDEKGRSKKRRGFLRGWRPSRKFFKRLAIVLGILLLVIIGYFGYRILVASGNIFRGGGQSLLGGDGIDKTKLQHEGDGRVNVLLAATSEDDPDHPGSILTDSIMVASIDPINKGVTLISIPRDLWVEMPGCTMYYQEKINAAYQCGEEIGFKEEGYPEGGMGFLEKIVETVIGININYYAKINYTAFRQAVDAVGGIDITIESPDPRGIYDPNFDWVCNYACTKVKHPNGPVHLDGEHALYLARSRNSAGGYGMPRGDFDRTDYQRKMMVALKDKATSVETFSNPIRLSGLIDSIGNNLVTNFSRDEILKLYQLAKDIPAEKTTSIGLADGDEAVLTTGNTNGISVVQPIAGLFEYGELHAFVRRQLPDPYVINEAPNIALYNGTGTPGLATEQKDLLESYGYKVVIMEDAPTQDYMQTEFYDNTNGQKEITRRYLENRYELQAKNGLPDAFTPTFDSGEKDEQGNPKPPKTADYVIILGQNL